MKISSLLLALFFACMGIFACSSDSHTVKKWMAAGKATCKTKPVASFSGFLVGDEFSSSEVEDFDGAVANVVLSGLEEGESFDVALADDTTRTLSVFFPEIMPNVSLDSHAGYFHFQVRNTEGPPTTYGFYVTDTDGLVLGAVSDLRLTRTISAGSTPSIVVSLEDAACESRDQDDCFESKTNFRLKFEQNGESLSLMQGETGTLGDYTYFVLVSQKAEKKDLCSEDSEIEMSYVIVRTDLVDFPSD